MKTLNEVYSALSMRRRYEVWFLRLGLADGSGAWWFRYLLTNPGRAGCEGHAAGAPAQVWATWFPRGATPQSFIQGFPLDRLRLSPRHRAPLGLSVADNAIADGSCRGHLKVDGHEITWDLRYESSFHVTLSDKGWIGFSRTPHSDTTFVGEITLDGRMFRGSPLGWGVQGHNCGFRHRNFWTWAHAHFPQPGSSASSFEALVYEMPFGLVFRKGVLWHEGRAIVFRNLREQVRDRGALRWTFDARARDGSQMVATLDGIGPSVHRVPYMKTDCSGTFEVANNSLANAQLVLVRGGHPDVELSTHGGAVLEMVGES